MKRIIIESTLLVANKNLANGGYNWISTYSRDGICNDGAATKETVNVIAIDCEKAENIPAKIKEFISEIEATHPGDKSLLALKEYERMLSEPLYKKDLPDDLLKVVRENFPMIKREDCILISGVSEAY